MDFIFDPDLASAETLPSRCYTDATLLSLEQARVFGRSWQWVGSLDELPGPGGRLHASIGGEPVVVVRDGEGHPRCFSSVCRHRAGRVGGEGKTLKCSYHGWTYDLEGRLLGAPEFEGVKGFDRAACRLPEFRAEAWGPWIFVNLDPAAPSLAEILGEMLPETAHWPLDRLRPVKALDYDLACDWKVYVDNYLEGYHIPVAHPELFRQVDYSAYRVETRAWHSRQHAPVKGAGTLYHRDLLEGAEPEALYYWLFPNLMVNVYPDHVQLNFIQPLGPGRCRTRFAWFVEEGRILDLEANLAFSDLVQQEDITLCEAVQQGLSSRTYDRGRYSAKRENGVHHFHQLWVEKMKG
jgi:choline monooxygenase